MEDQDTGNQFYWVKELDALLVFFGFLKVLGFRFRFFKDDSSREWQKLRAGAEGLDPKVLRRKNWQGQRTD